MRIGACECMSARCARSAWHARSARRMCRRQSSDRPGRAKRCHTESQKSCALFLFVSLGSTVIPDQKSEMIYDFRESGPIKGQFRRRTLSEFD